MEEIKNKQIINNKQPTQTCTSKTAVSILMPDSLAAHGLKKIDIEIYFHLVYKPCPSPDPNPDPCFFLLGKPLDW